jgi:hypothetical protein
LLQTPVWMAEFCDADGLAELALPICVEH